MKIVGLLAALAVLGCTPSQKQGAKTALDIAGAVCSELGTQDDPAFVQLICSAVDIVDGSKATFFARIKKEDAPAFARRCGVGSVAP